MEEVAILTLSGYKYTLNDYISHIITSLSTVPYVSIHDIRKQHVSKSHTNH